MDEKRRNALYARLGRFPCFLTPVQASQVKRSDRVTAIKQQVPLELFEKWVDEAQASPWPLVEFLERKHMQYLQGFEG